jgi:hypothetical protein
MRKSECSPSPRPSPPGEGGRERCVLCLTRLLCAHRDSAFYGSPKFRPTGNSRTIKIRIKNTREESDAKDAAAATWERRAGFRVKKKPVKTEGREKWRSKKAVKTPFDAFRRLCKGGACARPSCGMRSAESARKSSKRPTSKLRRSIDREMKILEQERTEVLAHGHRDRDGRGVQDSESGICQTKPS